MAEEEKVEPRIVEAVAVSGGRSSMSTEGGGKSPLAKLTEMAMTKAVEEAYAEGKGGDPDYVREKIQEARQNIKKFWAQKEQEFLQQQVTQQGNLPE